MKPVKPLWLRLLAGYEAESVNILKMSETDRESNLRQIDSSTSKLERVFI